jgi:hypothetical protein
MTKKIRSLLFVCLIIAAALYVGRFFSKKSPETTKTELSTDKVKIKSQDLKVQSSPEKMVTINKMKIANTPSPGWQKGLEKVLRAQGGNNLKEVAFKKIDSFVWKEDGVSLFVESVLVTLKNDKNASTTFKVLVDAQTGKILKNWDQPVFDPANPRNNFRIKPDPRYHGQ